ASSRVLAIPELLDLIFTYGDTDLHRHCALVCRAWSNAALNVLWREVNTMTLLIILRILSPLERIFPSPHGNSPTAEWNTPTAADWSRFTPYARRVRALKYHPVRDTAVSSALLNDLARTRTSHRIFPNLHTLHWLSNENCRSEEVFMHEGVQELRVQLERRWDGPGLADFSTSVAERTPMLTNLCIEPLSKDQDCQPLSTLFSLLQRLAFVSLPVNALTSDVLASLGTLPGLKNVQFIPSSDDYHPYAAYSPEAARYASPAPGSFPVLEDLSLCSSLNCMMHFLIDGTLLAKLSKLYLICPYIEQPLDVRNFFAAIAERYPHLLSLCVDIIADVDEALNKNCEPLTFDTLQPLLSISSLEVLDVRHNLPITLSEAELAKMGAALPAMRELGLNCEPLTAERPPTTIGTLPTVAEHFPRLETLRLFVDACTAPTTEDLARPARFKQLETIEFGLSPIGEDIQPVQLFLSRLFAEGNSCTSPDVTAGLTWDSELYTEDEELVSAMNTFWRRWQDVRRSLPLLVQLRRDEMRQRSELVREVEDLRMRSEVLAARARIPRA
ncbi:hypothetical protein K488DRAFT_39103, partial [Vararia minispora EC-137]